MKHKVDAFSGTCKMMRYIFLYHGMLCYAFHISLCYSYTMFRNAISVVSHLQASVIHPIINICIPSYQRRGKFTKYKNAI